MDNTDFTPKQKATELRDKYWHTCNCTIAGTSTIFKSIAKDCAIICVDEILNGFRKLLPSSRKYWEDVKTEILNLN